MSVAPVERPRRSVEHLVSATASRVRRPPTPRHIARRRMAVLVGKWLLPAGALALLAMIALWPEFDRAVDQSRLAIRGLAKDMGGAQVVDARYRGVDERGRPYTITASIAQQAGPERVNLTDPKGDVVQENGTWLMLQSKRGVFRQHANQLDLSRDVVLYRDDGTTFRTSSAAIDLKDGAAANNAPVHVEGPFGVLDAQGFTATDKGAVMQFAGPAHLLMNAHSE